MKHINERWAERDLIPSVLAYTPLYSMFFMCAVQYATYYNTVKSRNSKSSRLEALFLITSSSKYMVEDIKIYNPQNGIIFLLNICFGCVKEMSHRDAPFMHPKLM